MNIVLPINYQLQNQYVAWVSLGSLSNIAEDVCSYGFDDRCAALLDFLHHPESATDDRTIIDATKNSAEYLCESWWTGSLTASEVSLRISSA